MSFCLYSQVLKTDTSNNVTQQNNEYGVSICACLHMSAVMS